MSPSTKPNAAVKLLKLAAEGEPITILRRGIPVARLTPIASPPFGRQLGWDAGTVFEPALRPWTDTEVEAFVHGE